MGNNPSTLPSNDMAKLSQNQLDQNAKAQRILASRLRLSEYALTHTKEEVLRKTLDEICTLVNSPIGFYHFVHPDQKKLSLQAWSNRTLSEFCNIKKMDRHYTIDQAGVWVDCIRQGKPIIHNDYAALEHKKGYPPGHAEITRELVVPIFRGDLIVAILGVGNKPTLYNDDDIDIVTILADIAWDIAKNKSYEDDLRRSERLLNSTQEITGVGGWEWNNTTNRMYWTRNLYALHGFTPEEFEPGSLKHIEKSLECYDPADHETILNAFERCTSQGIPYSLELPFTPRNGKIKTIRTTARALRKKGKIVKVTGNLIDITDIKKAQSAIDEGARKYQTIIETAINGFCITDLKGDIKEANQAASVILGYPKEELLRMNISDIEALQKPEDVKKHIAKAIEQRGYKFETVHRKKNGELIDVEINCKHVDIDGGIIVTFFTDISQRKEADAKLKQNEQRFRAYFNTNPSATFVWKIIDKDFILVEINQAAMDLTEGNAQSFLHQRASTIYKDMPEMLSDMQRCAATRKPFEKEHHYQNRYDGSLDWINFKFTYLVPDFLIMYADVKTRQKEAEQALIRSEEKFKSMFQQAPLSYQSLDRHGNFVEVNTTWLQTMGYARDEVIGKNFSEFIAFEWRSHFLQRFPRFKAVGEILGVEFEMVKKDGSRVLVSFHGKIGKTPDGEMERTHCVFHDITLQKKAEDTLKLDLELNRSIARIFRELLSKLYNIQKVSNVTLEAAKKVTASEHGFVASIDKTTKNVIGHTLTEMFGAGCSIKNKQVTFPIEPDGSYNGLWGHCLNTKDPFYTNTPPEHPNYMGIPEGHIPLKNFLAVPVQVDNNLLGMIALANSNRDYSERDIIYAQRIAETFALALHRNEYEKQRAEMESRLRQLQKNEAIGALAGGIAHDFNNILAPIIGYAEMLQDDIPAQSHLQKNVQEVLAGAVRAKDLVKQILTFSRQHEQEITLVKPQIVIKEVVKLIKFSLPATIEFRQYIDNNCWSVLADPTNLHQVAMNLVTNAYHAMLETGGSLNVSLKNLTVASHEYPNLDLDAGPYVVFTVKDTGIGMDQLSMERIFDPYFTTKEKGKGTGLGLPIVLSIVKSLGGQIQVESEPEKGSTFKVFIPAVTEESATFSKKQQHDDPMGSESVLIVDDDPFVLELQARMLSRLGYGITSFSDSREALEELKSNYLKYDLVITDMTMPKITGDQLALEIRNLSSTLPVIICTGFSESMTPERAEYIGANGLLMKPVAMSELAKTVRSLLDNRHMNS